VIPACCSWLITHRFKRSNRMQRICWIVLITATALVASQAAAAAEPLMPVPSSDVPVAGGNVYQQPQAGVGYGQSCSSCQSCTSCQSCSGCRSGMFCTCRPAKCCHCESIYSLAPGCCEERRHCFDNAWAGYCDRRAHWDTVWCKVGTGGLYSCSTCPTHDGRGVALEAPLQPGAAACGCCQNH
jgi:hypothetical protein